MCPPLGHSWMVDTLEAPLPLKSNDNSTNILTNNRYNPTNINGDAQNMQHKSSRLWSPHKSQDKNSNKNPPRSPMVWHSTTCRWQEWVLPTQEIDIKKFSKTNPPLEHHLSTPMNKPPINFTSKWPKTFHIGSTPPNELININHLWFCLHVN